MPVAPRPLAIRCPACGWHTVHRARSDVLSRSDLPPARCPECGHAALQVQPTAAAGSWLEQLRRRLMGTQR